MLIIFLQSFSSSRLTQQRFSCKLFAVPVRKPRMSGLTAAAARLGVSRTQLREVINGNRKSKRLMARLRDAGIKVVA